ncbi:MAG: SsrA-binding protein SmpB [Thermoanaerobaculia bacterium]|jgi:SsrA-binding protein|nr:SsrA-binding protein SmpB [Thermoanaerobaculia bacterium]MBP9823286.1 SsrA-binding protein SmpB [Thermoanaerobaculia bacterium]
MNETTPQVRLLAGNRRAAFDYFIHERLEAGIALTGTEVKSARTGKIQLSDAFVDFQNGEAFLVGAHISPYSHGNRENHLPDRSRKLLLSRREIDKLAGRVVTKGYSVVPLQVYLRGSRIKVEIGLVQGKKLYDKRETKRTQELDREAAAAMDRATRGRGDRW